MTTAGTVQPDPQTAAQARKLLAELGPKGAAERLGVSQPALLRIAAGSSVRAGTLMMVTSAIETATEPATAGRKKAGA